MWSLNKGKKMAMIEWSKVGKVAFDTYCTTVNEVTHDGKKISPWSELGDVIRSGWTEAARAAYSYVLNKFGEEGATVEESNKDYGYPPSSQIGSGFPPEERKMDNANIDLG